MKGFLAVTHRRRFNKVGVYHNIVYSKIEGQICFATLLINCEDGICLIREILIQVCDIHHYLFRPLGGVLMNVSFPTLVNGLKCFLLIKSPPLARTLPHPENI